MSLDGFYSGRPWRSLVAQLRIQRADEMGNVICEFCGKPIVKKYDCIGHHKIPLNDANVGDYKISMNPENIMLVHFRCHNVIHDRWNGRKPGSPGTKPGDRDAWLQQVWIVHGAPCSGKTTYVREHAVDGDLILDMDRLYQMISTAGEHEHPARVKPCVFAVRDVIMEQIKMRSGFWRNAWVLSTKTELDIERDRQTLGARLIHVDTDRETCLRNLMEHPNGRDVEKWTRLIDDYFDRERSQTTPGGE